MERLPAASPFTEGSEPLRQARLVAGRLPAERGENLDRQRRRRFQAGCREVRLPGVRYAVYARDDRPPRLIR